MSKSNLTVVIGTARKGRVSANVVKNILLLAKKSANVSYADPLSLLSDPRTQGMNAKNKATWKKMVVEADALLFVIPEYNHGYPGEFKLLLDELYAEYKGKRVGLVGVSSGQFGGARMIESVRAVLNGMGMCPLQEVVYISDVQKTFVQGKPPASITKQIHAMIEALVT